MKLIVVFAFGTILFAIAFAGNTNLYAQSRNLITQDAVGQVRLGMTVAQARRAMPRYQFRRTSDGEGIALVEIRRRGRTYMTLYAGEEDPSKTIDNTARIEQIEVWNSIYRTPRGVYPRMRLSSAARIYGRVQEIMMSEIESREYATFANQPSHLTFRVQAFGRNAGIYPRGQNKTTRAASNAYIFSIIISQRPTSGGGSNVGFSSQYTDFSKDCNTPDGQGDDGGHISSFCKGYGDYRLHVFDTATTLEINAETPNEEKIFHVASQSLAYDIEQKRLEWRMANGKPFAVILQVNKYRTNENGLIAYPQTVVGSYYTVKGLDGYEEIDYKVDITRQPNLLQRARQMADDAYMKKNPSMGGGSGGGSSNTAYQNVDVNQINQTIDRAARRGNNWVKSPMQVLARLAGDFNEMKSRMIQLNSPSSENSDSIMVTVTNDGLMDDSVRSEKYVYKLEKTSRGVWKVTSAQKSWKCQPNRGHQDFSAVPCN